MYWDDIKLVAKNEKELENIKHPDKIYSQDRGMEFGIEKYTMFVKKSGNRHMTDRMELPNNEKLERSEKKKPTKFWVSWRLTPSNKCK